MEHRLLNKFVTRDDANEKMKESYTESLTQSQTPEELSDLSANIAKMHEAQAEVTRSLSSMRSAAEGASELRRIDAAAEVRGSLGIETGEVPAQNNLGDYTRRQLDIWNVPTARETVHPFAGKVQYVDLSPERQEQLARVTAANYDPSYAMVA